MSTDDRVIIKGHEREGNALKVTVMALAASRA